MLFRSDFFSWTRFEAINTTLKLRMKSGDEEATRFDPSYFFSFIKYHSKWEDDSFSFDELKDPKCNYLGYYMHSKNSINSLGESFETETSDEKSDLDPIVEEVLYDLMDYLKDKDYQVLFLDTPHRHSANEAKRMNTLCDILDENGFEYLLCELDDKYNRETDFYNDGHVNYYGAEIFTEWFGGYLTENYDLPDRRLDKKCDKDWIGVYDTVKEGIEVFEAAKTQQEAA